MEKLKAHKAVNHMVMGEKFRVTLCTGSREGWMERTWENVNCKACLKLRTAKKKN